MKKLVVVLTFLTAAVAFAALPKRLTISFPIWGLMDTAPTGAYHDLDKMVREHVERGFNCIRLESGAALTHDIHGRRRGAVGIHAPFGRFTEARQLFVIGGEGMCDYMQRLIDLCKACRRHDVYLILSSWYFLHTCWYSDTEINDEIYAIPTEKRFMAFAKYLHYILRDLKREGLADRIAAAEIFNEMGDLRGKWEQEGRKTHQEIDKTFRAEHEAAIAFLRERHPDILISCDDYARKDRIGILPRNMQVLNGHNYFMWSVYAGALEGGAPRGDFFQGRIKPEDVVASYAARRPHYAADWIDRIRYCHDVDPAKIPAMEAYLEKRLTDNWDDFVKKLDTSCQGYQDVMKAFPGVRVVCGEGVTYCSSKLVNWEEKSDKYWEMVELMMRRYREIGLWGTVVKTCCGPEDPSWHMCKDKLKRLNDTFLKD